YLLDDIPNLSFFKFNKPTFKTSLEKEQQASFFESIVNKRNRKGNFYGNIKYKFYQRLKENSISKYRSSFKLYYSQNFVTDFKLQRDFNGKERVIYRKFSYQNNKGRIKEITAGNFYQRLGLGTIFGYRGKLFDFSSQLDGESFLFPDYGGYNGLYINWQQNRFNIKNIGSINRDSSFQLTSWGTMITYRHKKYTPGIILGINNLKNRNSNKDITTYRIGFYSAYRYHNGYNSFEISARSEKQNHFAAMVTEGQHQFQKAAINYAGWIYDDNFYDLTGGSKTGNIYHKNYLREIEFDYSDKRSGQKGFLFRTMVILFNDISLANSLIYATLNADTSEVQWLTEFAKKVNGNFLISLDYLEKRHKRNKLNYDNTALKRQTRIETKYQSPKLYLRNYVSYKMKTDKDNYFSLFTNLKYSYQIGSQLEIWLNLAEIDTRTKSLNYLYSFVKNNFYLLNNIKISVKFTYNYNRKTKEKHQTEVSFDLNYLI
ncbi:MAG: hypothetical protein GXO93_05000, partial [FCB group bacterium]|nr:hypothetical protein [FCB group bacterium]